VPEEIIGASGAAPRIEAMLPAGARRRQLSVRTLCLTQAAGRPAHLTRVHQDELSFGCYFSAGIMMPGENGPPVPESARRATLPSCRHDPARALLPVLTSMPGQGNPPGDLLSDSGCAHRDATARALPARAAGAPAPSAASPPPRTPPPATSAAAGAASRAPPR
jgi:hypothetical protein